MARQGFALQLTSYDAPGWRATFYNDGDGALADECDGHRLGAHAVARDAAGGVGGVEEDGGRHPMMRSIFVSVAFLSPRRSGHTDYLALYISSFDV
jgi:hypothetical protein